MLSRRFEPGVLLFFFIQRPERSQGAQGLVRHTLESLSVSRYELKHARHVHKVDTDAKYGELRGQRRRHAQLFGVVGRGHIVAAEQTALIQHFFGQRITAESSSAVPMP